MENSDRQGAGQSSNNRPEQMDYNQLYKIILVGDTGVGKTHLLNKYVKGVLPRNPVPTIGVQFATKTVTLKNGERVKAQIWDTAGQEQYRSITMAHYRRASGAIVVYDITRESTFNNVKRWLENIKEQADPDVVIMLVGNKNDLVDRVVRKEEGKSLADHEAILFQETSAKEANNVNNIFEKLLEEINFVKKQTDQGVDKTLRISQMKDNNRQKGCEC